MAQESTRSELRGSLDQPRVSADPTEADLTLELDRSPALSWPPSKPSSQHSSRSYQPLVDRARRTCSTSCAPYSRRLQQALTATLSEGQRGLMIEPGWRRDYPEASQLHGQHELKSREAQELGLVIGRKQQRWSNLKNIGLPHARGTGRGSRRADRSSSVDRSSRRGGPAISVAERSPFAELRRGCDRREALMAERQELQVVLRTVSQGAGAEQTAAGLRQVRQEAAAVNTTTQQAAASVLKWAGGLGLAATAASALGHALGASLEVHKEFERITRATAAAYGANAQVHQLLGSACPATGFTSRAILEAALSARTLSANYGLTIQQTQDLSS